MTLDGDLIMDLKATTSGTLATGLRVMVRESGGAPSGCLTRGAQAAHGAATGRHRPGEGIS